MSIQTRRITAVILVLLAAAVAGVIYSRITTPHRNVSQLVARALSHDADVDYIAYVVTEARYNGKNLKTRATVFHQGGIEKVVRSGAAGPPVWSMNRDGKSYTYLPGEKRLLVSETSKMLSDADRSKLLAKSYRAASDGVDRVAGRDAYVVNISSRYNGRPSKKLWIDKQHLTILKSVDYSATGAERGGTEMTRITYNTKIPPDTFAVPTEKSVRVVMVCKSAKSMGLFRELGFPVRAPKYLPAGYKIEGYHLFNCQCNCNHRSAQLTYTDGLNVISIFQTPKTTSCAAGGCKVGDKTSRKGCVVENCDVARTGSIIRDDRTIVVVGDLTPEDVKRIAQSVLEVRG